MIEAVVFDMDGVILDTEKLVIECSLIIAPKYGINNVEEHCRVATGCNREYTKKLWEKRYGKEVSYDDFRAERAKLFHKKFYEGEPLLKVGAIECLKWLKEHGIKTALASSTASEHVIPELKHVGAYEYLDEIITGEMVTRSKPEPDIFLLACEKLGVNPANTFAIEDSYNGIRSARAAGMRAIMVPDLLPPTDEMQELSEVILEDLIKVRDYIKEEL